MIACFTHYLYLVKKIPWTKIDNLKNTTQSKICFLSNSKKVLMGDSITEFWKINDPDFFTNYY
jgi:hypothetical protein